MSLSKAVPSWMTAVATVPAMETGGLLRSESAIWPSTPLPNGKVTLQPAFLGYLGIGPSLSCERCGTSCDGEVHETLNRVSRSLKPSEALLVEDGSCQIYSGFKVGPYLKQALERPKNLFEQMAEGDRVAGLAEFTSMSVYGRSHSDVNEERFSVLVCAKPGTYVPNPYQWLVVVGGPNDGKSLLQLQQTRCPQHPFLDTLWSAPVEEAFCSLGPKDLLHHLLAVGDQVFYCSVFIFSGFRGFWGGCSFFAYS